MIQPTQRQFRSCKQAIERGDFGVLSSFVSKGLDVNFIDLYAQNRQTIIYLDLSYYSSPGPSYFSLQRCATLLQAAVSCGHLKMVELLLEYGADSSVCTRSLETLLHIAAIGGHMGIAGILLGDSECVVNARSADGYTPFHYAVANGRLELVRVLHEKIGPTCINDTTNLRETALNLAVRNNKQDVVEYLLDNQAAVDALDSRQRTALHYAIAHENVRAFTTLVQHNASIYTCDDDENPPIALAIRQKNTQLVGLLLDAGVNVNSSVGETFVRTLLHFACRERGMCDVARLLIERGADVNSRDMYGTHVMEHSFYERNDDFTRLLLENEADVNWVSNSGKTALHIIVQDGVDDTNIDILQLILEKNININAQDHGGQTALMRSDTVDVFDMLLTKGARVDIQNNDGKTVLAYINNWLIQHHPHFLRSLLEEQPDLNSFTHHNTVLQSALRENMRPDFNILRRVYARRIYAKMHPPRDVHDHEWQYARDVLRADELLGDVLQALIAAQNAIDAREYRGLTPLHFALLMKKTRIAEALLRAGADTTIRDDTGLSLMQYAVHSREHTVLELLFELQGTADGNEALLMAMDLDNVEAVQRLLHRHHCELPVDLRARLRMSPKTKALLGTYCLMFLTRTPGEGALSFLRNQVLVPVDLNTLILQHATGLSSQNIHVLYDYYKSQRRAEDV